MPQPKPNDGETHEEWIDRCMSNPTMKNEFDDNDQRLAVCNTIWEDSRSKEPTAAFNPYPCRDVYDGLQSLRGCHPTSTPDTRTDSEIKTTMKPERLALANKMAEVRVAKQTDDDDSPHEIRGYAAVFYNGTPETEFKLFDDMVERIMPGAFDDVLAGNPDVRGLFNHDPDHLLGRTSAGTMSLSVDGKGLAYSITLGDTTVARDVAKHVQRGDIDGSSFAFRVQSERFRTEDGIDIREIEKVEPLFDCGPVTYPAYVGTAAGFRATEDIAREIRAAIANKAAPAKQPAQKSHPPGWRPRSEEDAETKALHDWAENLT